MTKSEVKIGGRYEVRWHDGSITVVEITGAHRYPIQSGSYPWRTTGYKTRYSARNLATGRQVVIKSASKLRREVPA